MGDILGSIGTILLLIGYLLEPKGAPPAKAAAPVAVIVASDAIQER